MLLSDEMDSTAAKRMSLGSVGRALSMVWASGSLDKASAIMLSLLKPQCIECSSEVKDTTDVGVFCSRCEAVSLVRPDLTVK